MNNTELFVDTCLVRLPGKIDAAARQNARHCLIDSLAAAFGGLGEPAIDILVQATLGAESRGPATLIGSSRRSAPEDAALINGTLISLQLFDDNHALMRGHPSAPLWPAVLALAEARDLELGRALDAFILGYEAECRLGTLFNPSHYELGWHATATQGTFGAAIAAAALLDLDADKARHALGIAASMTGGIRRNFGSMTMSLHSGLASSSGLRAARLAAGGFTADPAIFDGALGVGQVLSPEWRDAALSESLPRWGEPFAIVAPGPIFKLYPCGRPPLFAIDAAVEIMRRHKLVLADIADILAEVSFLYPRTLIHTRPENGLQGKTSLQYCIAATLVDGGPGFASFTDAAVRRPEILRLLELIRVEVPPHLSEDVPAVRRAPFDQPVTLTIRMRDGQSYRETITCHRGEKEKPATLDDLRGKFADCTATHLKPAQGAAVLDAIADERFKVRQLMALLAS